jgi:GPI-anchor transamidase subunit S
VVVSQLRETVSSLILPLTSTEQDHRVAQYSPRYHLSFTLLNEDAAAGHSVSKWAVSDAISRKKTLICHSFIETLRHRVGHISPILTRLSVLHNFTIESQVQFHAPLAFKPLPVDTAFGITPEDLTVFVNSAEWTLCDYTLWLLLYPSKLRFARSVQHIK